MGSRLDSPRKTKTPCPGCGHPLTTDGLKAWCSHYGTRGEPLCFWGLSESRTEADARTENAAHERAAREAGEPKDGIGDPPEGVPRWLWCAAHDLRNEMERIDGEAMDAGQQAQDPDADRYEWCKQVAGLLDTHRIAAENAARYAEQKRTVR